MKFKPESAKDKLKEQLEVFIDNITVAHSPWHLCSQAVAFLIDGAMNLSQEYSDILKEALEMVS